MMMMMKLKFLFSLTIIFVFFSPSRTQESLADSIQDALGGLDVPEIFKTLFAGRRCFGPKGGFTDPQLGTFKRDCNKNCLRNLACCPPMTPKELDVRFIYSSSKTNGQFITLKDRIRSRKKIAWIIHGFLNHYFEDRDYNDTKDAYIDRGYDAIIVDWNKGNRDYGQAVSNVQVVGALVGQMMAAQGAAGRSVCVGFSLGAHVCGEAGEWLRDRGVSLAKCDVIDPAGPGFDGCGPEYRIDPLDCAV